MHKKSLAIGMGLRKARIGRAEDLPPEIRELYRLPSSGMIVIETRNPDLKDNIIPINPEKGIRGYLLTLGNFKDVEVKED